MEAPMNTTPSNGETREAPARLSLDNLVEVMERTEGADGKVSYDHLYKYYAPNMRFQDSIQTIHGREPFIDMCKRLAKRSNSLKMKVTGAAQNGNYIFFQWTMTINFANTKTTPMYGCSKLTLNADGQILEQRDYYDLWGDTFDVIPGVGKLYRMAMQKLFG